MKLGVEKLTSTLLTLFLWVFPLYGLDDKLPCFELPYEETHMLKNWRWLSINQQQETEALSAKTHEEWSPDNNSWESLKLSPALVDTLILVLYGFLRRKSQSAIPGFLIHRHHKIINVGCLKLLNFGVILYAAIDNK